MFVTLAPGCPVLPPVLGCVRHFRRRKFCSRPRGQVGESRRSAQKELPGREEPPVGNKYIAGRHHTQHNGASYDTQHNSIECHYAKCHDYLNVILSVVRLSVAIT
jgi:hypothetical protein